MCQDIELPEMFSYPSYISEEVASLIRKSTSRDTSIKDSDMK
jgi:hypothetical protein